MIVKCERCGAEYEMPDIGIKPRMVDCPECKDLVKTWISIGPPDSKGAYSKQKIFCKITNKEATLMAQSNGVVVCSDWKRCGDHMKRGAKPCPVVVSEAILKNMSKGKNIKFAP